MRETKLYPAEISSLPSPFGRMRFVGEHLLYARTDLFLNNAATFIIRYRREGDPPIVCNAPTISPSCNYFPLLSMRDRPRAIVVVRALSDPSIMCAQSRLLSLSYRDYFKILIINLPLRYFIDLT